MKFSKIWEELNKERSISEINMIISNSLIEKGCTILVMILVFMPVIICITNIFNDKELYWLYNWYQYNLSIGMLGIVVGFILIIKFLVSNKQWALKTVINNNKVKTLLLLLFIWSIISFIFSTNHKVSFFGDFYRREGLLCYIGYLGIFILTSQVKDKNKQRIIFEVMVVTASLLALICLIGNQYILEQLRLNITTGIFYNQNHYGYYLVICIVINEILLINDKNKYISLLHLLELAILINGLINTKSMGPLLAIIIATIVYLIVLISKNIIYLKKCLLIASVCFLSGYFSSIDTWNLHEDFTILVKDVNTMAANKINAKELQSFDSIGSSRGKLWRNGLRFIVERPLVGYGPDNLGERYYQAGCSNDRAHNELIQMSASLGIPALAFYLVMLFVLLIRFFKYFQEIDYFTLGIYCCLGGYLISSFFGNTTFYVTPFYFLVLSILDNCTNQLSQKHHKLNRFI